MYTIIFWNIVSIQDLSEKDKEEVINSLQALLEIAFILSFQSWSFMLIIKSLHWVFKPIFTSKEESKIPKL